VQETGSVTVTREEILAFGREFDPQPFHVDEDAARRSPYGGLIASGWHTAALSMRLIVALLGTGSGSLGNSVLSIATRPTGPSSPESPGHPGTG
jgi:acyl dehydratase